MRRITVQIILFSLLATAVFFRVLPEPAALAIFGVGLAYSSRSLQRERRQIRRRSDRRTWGIAPVTPLVLVKRDSHTTSALRKTA